jgi:hypothetical protein
MKILLGALAGGLLLASAAMAQDVTVQHESNSPVLTPGDGTNNAQANVRASNNYQALVDRNAGFRNARMHKECDPIASADLRQECNASFGSGATGYGSSGMSSSRIGR